MSGIEEAITALGGINNAAMVVGTTLSTMARWRLRGEVRSLREALRLARATGIAVERFCLPDSYDVRARVALLRRPE